MPKKVQISNNPFLVPLEVPIFYKNDYVGTASGGAILESRPIEIEMKVSIYPHQLIKLIPVLSASALKLLLCILPKLRYNKDYFELRPEDFIEITGFKKSMLYKCLNELLAGGVLSKRASRIHTYWFNPALFFFGNRVVAFPENVIVSKNSLPLQAK